MNNKLFVRNISFKMTESSLQALFTESGTVLSAVIPKDRETGRQRGFAFIEMSTQAEAEEAIKRFDGQEIEGRQIAVSIAQPKPRTGGGFGGGNRDRR